MRKDEVCGYPRGPRERLQLGGLGGRAGHEPQQSTDPGEAGCGDVEGGGVGREEPKWGQA